MPTALGSPALSSMKSDHSEAGPEVLRERDPQRGGPTGRNPEDTRRRSREELGSTEGTVPG